MSKRQKERTNQNRERRLGTGEGIARTKGSGTAGIPLWMWALSLSGFLALGVVIAVLLLTRGGSASGNPNAAVIKQRDSTAKVDWVSEGTWPANYTNLADAIKALGLPGLSDTVQHYHTHIHLIVEGHDAPVPLDIGLDAATQTYAPIHTHDTRSVIHIEADVKNYHSDLQNVFDIWGVRFNSQCVGGYCNGVKMWVNGVPSTQFGAYVMQPHDAITIVEGKPPAGFKPDASFKFEPGE